MSRLLFEGCLEKITTCKITSFEIIIKYTRKIETIIYKEKRGDHL